MIRQKMFTRPLATDHETVPTTTTRGYLVHWDTNPTSEGLGSHCRGSLFPLLHIAIRVGDGFLPIWRTENASWQNNLARDYSMLDIGHCFGLEKRSFEDKDDDCLILEIHTWTDKQIGSCCGDAHLLAESIHNYLQRMKQHNDETAFKQRPIVIYLNGPLKYMNPSAEVYQWLQQKCRMWCNNNKNNQSSSVLRVAAHVRVPEDFCGAGWKEDNSIKRLTHGLQKLQGLLNDHNWELNVYTEASFRNEDEVILKNVIGHVHVHRGSTETLLSDMKEMATADLFLPSASHLSALVGYLSTGGIILTLASRLEYFQCHADLGSHVVDVNDQEKLRALVQMVTGKKQMKKDDSQGHASSPRIMG